MAEPAVAFAPSNLAAAAGVALTASSYQTALPPSYALDPLRSKPWRSAPGWNVVSDFNDRLDFIEGGVAKVAELAAGAYPTASLYAAEVARAMDAAAAANTYVVTYSSVSRKFTLARASGASAFGIELSSVSTRSAAPDLGFATGGADLTGATEYEAPGVSYHSREWLKVDLGAAAAVAFAGALEHNLAAAGTLTLAAAASDSWASPAALYILAGTGAKRVAWSALGSYRWWRLVVNDVANPDGYSELGVFWLDAGVYPTKQPQSGYGRPRRELSQITAGDQGAHFVDLKQGGEGYALAWGQMPEADLETFFELAAAVRVGVPFWFALDAANDPDATLYVFTPAPIAPRQVRGTSPALWELELELLEALG